MGVDFYSDDERLNKLELTNSLRYLNPGIIGVFEEIRIEPNDRKKVKLYPPNIQIPKDIKELNAKLIFKTTHKDIQKKIKLIRN